MDLLTLFADNLLPVFLIAGAGWLLRARLGTEPRGVAHASLYILAPALILDLMVQNRVPVDGLVRMMGFAFACLLLPALLAFAVARWCGWSRGITSAVVLTVMLTNAGNYGMSVTMLAFGPNALPQASLFFIASSIVSYSAGVFVASLGRAGVREAFGVLVRTPTVWAVVLASGMGALHLSMPGPVASAVHLLSQACVPVFLLVLGMQLHGAKLKGPAKPLLFATAMRLGGGLAAGLLLAPVFGLTGVPRQAGLLQSGMPSAVVATLLASEYDVEPAFVISVVLATTLLSPFTLTPLLAFLRAGH
jgi:hypothetical protein